MRTPLLLLIASACGGDAPCDDLPERPDCELAAWVADTVQFHDASGASRAQCATFSDLWVPYAIPRA